MGVWQFLAGNRLPSEGGDLAASVRAILRGSLGEVVENAAYNPRDYSGPPFGDSASRRKIRAF